MATVIPTFDASGLRTLTLSELRENLRDSVASHSDLGPNVSTGDHTIVGNVLDANAIELERLYRLVDDLWAATDPDAAEGVQQDNVNRLRGVVRNPARYSTVTLTLGGTPTLVVPAGSIAGIPNGGERWLTDSDATIGGGGTVDVTATAENPGAIDAAIGAITDVVSGPAGWNTVTNAAKANEGEPIETDADYRVRSENGTTGSTTEGAIYTRLSELDDVDAVACVSNRGPDTDSYGTPGNTMWIVVYPDTANQAAIAATIWGEAGAAGGIGFRGSVTATVTDANGYPTQIAWDWAVAVDAWISVTGTKDSDYPAGGDVLVKSAITAYFATVRVGQDVYPTLVHNAVIDAVPGIKTLTVLMKIGGAPGGGDTAPITININQYADLNSTIGVTIT
jgi:hypothetical protein